MIPIWESRETGAEGYRRASLTTSPHPPKGGETRETQRGPLGFGPIATRLEANMRRAFQRFEDAEQHEQPDHILDRFEADYLQAVMLLERVSAAGSTEMR